MIIRPKKLFIIFLVISLLASQSLPVYAYGLAPEYLCELGLNFYQQGRVDLALHEFQKALIVQPSYEPALRYIKMIQEQTAVPAPAVAKPLVEKPLPEAKPRPEVRKEILAIKKMLDGIEREKEKEITLAEVVPAEVPATLPPVPIPAEVTELKFRLTKQDSMQ